MFICMLYGTARTESFGFSTPRRDPLRAPHSTRPPAATQPSLKEIEGHASSPQPKWKVWKVDTPRGEIVRALREWKKARKRWGGIS